MQSGLIAQFFRLLLGTSPEAEDKGMWADFQYNLLHFKFLHSCRLAHQPSVYRQAGLWSSREWHGTAFLGWVNAVESFWSPKANCSHFLLTTAQLIPQEYLSGLNTSAVTALGHEWQPCLYRTCSHRCCHKIQCTRWFVTEQRRPVIKYHNQWAFCSCTRHAQQQILLSSIPAASGVCPLSPHLPLALTASQKEAFAANCWVELATVQSSAGKWHYCASTKPATRCGKYPKCRRGERQSQHSGPSLQRKQQKAIGSSSGSSCQSLSAAQNWGQFNRSSKCLLKHT